MHGGHSTKGQFISCIGQLGIFCHRALACAQSWAWKSSIYQTFLFVSITCKVLQFGCWIWWNCWNCLITVTVCFFLADSTCSLAPAWLTQRDPALVTDDNDWCRLNLLAESRHRLQHRHRFEDDSDTPVVHFLPKVHCRLLLLCLQMADQTVADTDTTWTTNMSWSNLKTEEKTYSASFWSNCLMRTWWTWQIIHCVLLW